MIDRRTYLDICDRCRESSNRVLFVGAAILCEPCAAQILAAAAVKEPRIAKRMDKKVHMVGVPDDIWLSALALSNAILEHTGIRTAPGNIIAKWMLIGKVAWEGFAKAGGRESR